MWNLNKVAVQPGPVQSVWGISHNPYAHIGEEMWRQENPDPCRPTRQTFTAEMQQRDSFKQDETQGLALKVVL